MTDKLGAILVSLLATVFFGVIVLVWMFRPPTGDVGILNVLVGALSAGYGTVLNYWLGSSRSSASKDETIRGLAAPTQGSN